MENLSFTLNGKPVSLAVDGERMLLWVLRTDLGLTGTKFGCGQDYCGACTVLLDGTPIHSCTFPVKLVAGKKVTTIEGLSKNGKLHPIQQAFADHDALQCGFCTPGMILGAYGLLAQNPNPARSDIVEGMQGHLCRCGAHKRIVEAIETAARVMQGGEKP